MAIIYKNNNKNKVKKIDMFWLDNRKTCIYYKTGSFDDYCVAINGRGYNSHAPTDKEYFEWIKTLSHTYGVEQVYNDFCQIYNIVGEITNKDDAIIFITRK